MDTRVSGIDRSLWPWLLVAGLLLGALAVFAPLPALAVIIGLLVVFAFFRGWPVSGMVLLILASLLTHFKADIGPISVRPEHVAVLLVGALLAWELIFHGRALPGTAGHTIRLDWPAVFALAWFGLNVVAAAVNAPDFSDSLRHIVRLALMPLTYIVGINLVRTPRQWRLALTAFLLLAVAEATYGVLTRVLLAFGIDLGVQIAWVLTEPVPFGTLEEGNMFGSHSGSWLILLLALLLAGLARPGRSARPPRSLHLLLLATGILITALAVALSLSRGAWVALLIALALLFVFYSPRPLGQYVRGTLLAFGAPLLVVGLLFALQVLPAATPLLARLRSFTQVATDATVSQRLGDANLALVNWEVHPWLGWGPGTFYQLHGLRNWEPAWIASQSVRTLQETGVLGLLAYGGFVVTLLWAGVKGIRAQVGRPRTRAALLGLTIGFILLQIAYQSTDGTWLAAIWVHAALLATGARLLSGTEDKTKNEKRKTQDAAHHAPRTTHHAIRNTQYTISNLQSPISLLFVHSSDEMYGSDVVLLELVRRLDRSRFAPIVALPTDLPYETGKARLSDELAKLGIPVVRVDFAVLRRRYLSPRGLPRLLLRLWRGSRGLAAVIRENDVRIVHANTVAVLGGAVAAKLAHVPLVWHVHEIITEPAWFRRLIARLVTAWADRVVAISTPVAEHLLAAGAVAGARAKTVVIPDAVDTDHFTPQVDGSAARVGWGIGPEDVLVGTVGRLHTWKGQEVLVEAARILRERARSGDRPEPTEEAARILRERARSGDRPEQTEDRPERPVKVVIAGDIVPGQPEPREALAAAIAGHGLADRVQLVGFWPDVRQVMAALDVLVLPSTRPEPFGLVVVQAMACGKPVIATAHGGPLEIIVDGETGLLVPAADPVALADAIERLANDPALRARLGAAGRQRAVKKFGFTPHVAAFEQVYLAA